jgi:anti-sigma factor RsiW
MSWTCEQTEARLSDYLDGMLVPAEVAEFRAHVPGCPRCAPLLASVSDLLSGMHAMEQVEPPPRLVYAILDNTLGPREVAASWLHRIIRPMATLRFAYGALSMAATLVIFVSAAGFNWKHPKLADLRPATVYRRADNSVHTMYASTTKFVNNLRVVNEIQSRLRQDSELPTNPENTLPETSPQKDPGSTDGTRPATPRQQNRANDLMRHIEVLAMELPATCSRFGTY